MKAPVPRFFMGPAVLLISFLTLASTPIGVLAKINKSRPPGKSEHHRSLRELSSRVHRELRFMARSSAGFNAAALVPQATKQIHRIIAEGSAGKGDDFDSDARALALEALQSGANVLFQEVKQMENDRNSRGLRGDKDHVGFDEDYHLEFSENEHRLLTVGKVGFYLVLTSLVVMAVGSIVGTDDVPGFVGQTYNGGIKGSGFSQSTSIIFVMQVERNILDLTYFIFSLSM